MKWKPALPEKDIKLFYTKGSELMFEATFKEYRGVYFEKNKRFHTYIDSGDGPRDLLVPLNTNKEFLLYAQTPGTKQPTFFPATPQETIVYPKERDYKKGYFDRYFAKKINDKNAIIKEINKDNKKGVKAQQQISILYKIIEVRWKLTGPRHDVNIDKAYNPYSAPTTDDFGQNDSGIVYGIEDTNRRTVALKNKEMPGLVGKIINYIQFTEPTSYPPTT
jgi:hypothetical protein